MRRAHKLVRVVVCLALAGPGCGGEKKPRARGELSDAERSVIAAFTQGAISRESPVRVVFAEAYADPARLGTPIEPSPFRFEPRVTGVAVWTAVNALEFRPAERLDNGRSYTATLDVKGLLTRRAPIPRFEFSFSAVRQSFSVDVDGLQAAPADVRAQQLTGRLVTADVDDASKVEQILHAALGSRALAIEWTHSPDRRTHPFIVRGITRAEEETMLRLAWDGAPIGVAAKDSRDVKVPGLNTFTVDQARAVQGREQYIELRFTDALQQGQSLQGLIRVGNREDLRFTVQGSVVQVFSAANWTGEQTVRVSAGIRNVLGYRLRKDQELAVSFERMKPQVRFVGKGVIVPSSPGMTIPIEAVNLRAVMVEAMHIPEGTIPQFLQVNDLAGENELQRVGRVVWQKTIPLDLTPDQENRWVRFDLDVSPLVRANPGGMYRLDLSFRRPHVIWPCAAGENGPSLEPTRNSDTEQEASYWDSWEEEGDWRDYQRRMDPCSPAYYRPFYDHNVKVGRNVLVSDLGIVAKGGEDDFVLVAVTDLRTTAPVSGAEVVIQDYQQQPLAAGRTNGDGLARLAVERKPFLAVVKSGGQTGYLRLDDGSALSVAHFDVGGVRAPQGLKGFLYGERGVWRPGDTLHLAFILSDPAKRLPAGHPVRFDLVNSRGQLVKSITRTQSTEGFYAFEVPTSPEAPTGNYTGRVTVGGAVFEKVLKVETVMPNRLKIAMDFGTDVLRSGAALAGKLTSSWLHGAPARGLKADVEVALRAAETHFPRYADYVFDDPTRKYQAERRMIFEGRLDESGATTVGAEVEAANVAPGMLDADFTTRVFEPGGAFSIDRFSIPYSPYARYVGIRAPKGDEKRGMLLTDQAHELSIVAVDPKGNPTGGGAVEVKLYKIDWRWWWERGDEDLSAYAEASVHTPLASGVVELKDGVGSWTFEIKSPDWGRYLITAKDQTSGHRTGRLVYIDWPGWAGRGQNEMAGGADVLPFAPDKPEYKVGETVTLVLPTPQKGRALVSLEQGSRVLRTEWIEAKGAETRFTFKATPEMAPTAYAQVTLLQPHAQSANDLPIRLYGVAPVKVVNPETRLQPTVECPEVMVPEGRAEITVGEAAGRPMAYTVAVVDEGLLGLTRYSTPNPWDYFYAREALAVKTWDVYDNVVGAHGAALERMLAIGGDEAGVEARAKRANRFPPMVRFLGPYSLGPHAKKTHAIDIPQYVGAVRVMVVAGRDGAFGATEKSVFVRKPLMLLATLPRVVGPEEEVELPVSVFALEPKVKDVAVSVTTSGPIALAGPATRSLTFKTTGDEVVGFKVKAAAAPGIAKAVIRAVSGAERAEQSIELDVRMPTVRAVNVAGATLKPGESWPLTVTFPGMAGTNEATLEVSRVPPIDLGRRLEYLLEYPYGCIEQTVSAAFPQLFLSSLLELSADQKARIESNVKAAIERLKTFQTSEGGFGYWPGDDDANDWASSYAGHFMVEAQKAGYLLPPGLLDQWLRFQARRARGWGAGVGQAELTQAYRLYTLALAGSAELGAMNQLRERAILPVTARWRLAAAYQLAGQPEAARALSQAGVVEVKPYRELFGTFGSDLRDRAMVLEALLLLDQTAQVGTLIKEIAAELSQDQWLSTQEIAYALLALSRAAGGTAKGSLSFSYDWDGAAPVAVTSGSPLVQRPLKTGTKTGATLAVRNTGNAILYPRLVTSGLPAVGSETAASQGIGLQVEYLSLEDKPIDPSALAQGTDFKARVKVTNTGARGRYDELALSHLVASGWEIRNERLFPAARAAAGLDYQDIRDDRVYSYFGLNPGETKTLELLLNASYLGTYYLPVVSVEAMYDATINARTKGQWVRVIEPGAALTSSDDAERGAPPDRRN